MKVSDEEPRPLRQRTAAEGQELLHIGAVAERLGLSLRSIRYYEETKLVIPSGRTPGGFRQYSESDVQRLLLVMQMKPLDYSLDEMRDLLELLDRLAEPTLNTEDDLNALAEFADDVEDRWKSLRARVEVARRFRTYLREELAGHMAATGELPVIETEPHTAVGDEE